MKAVILAAGLGARMRPFTNNTPKALAPYGRHTLIQELISALTESVTYEEIIIVIGYLGEQIVSRVGPISEGGVLLRYVAQRTQSGTYDALLCAEKALGGAPFVVACADDVQDKEALTKLSLFPNAMVVAHADDPRPYGVVELGIGSLITNIEEKPQHPKSNWVNTGCIKTTCDIFAERFRPARQRNGERMLTHAVARMIADNVAFQAITTNRWTPVSTLKDLVDANARLRPLI